MPVGGETLVAGGYTVSWFNAQMGILEGDQGLPRLEQSVEAEDVGNTSAYGKSVIDGIYQGANWTAGFTCLEYKAASTAAFWPYDGTLGRMGVIGRLLYSISQALVYTAIANTSASASPASLTASKSILLPRFATGLVYGPTLRRVPLRFRLFPYSSGGNVVWFTQT